MSEGNFYYQLGKYSKAANLYKKVGRCDTNYAEVLLDLCVAYNADKEDSLCYLTALKGIGVESAICGDFYNLAGISLREMKRYQEAYAMFDEGIKQYPYLYLLPYNKGKTYYEEKKFSDAEKCFQEAVRLNEYHANSHYFLGKCALDQGRTIPAILSFEFYLIVTSSNERADKVVTTVEDVYNSNYDYDVDYKVESKDAGDQCFDPLAELISSQVALKPSYKNKTGVDLNFVKERQAMFEKLEYQPNTGNWYMEHYVRLFVEIQNSGQFNAFNLWTLSSLQNQQVYKGFKKNKKKIRAFGKWVVDYVNDHSIHPALSMVTEEKDRDIIFYDNKVVAGVGHTNPATKEPYGEWIYFYSRSGFVLGRGNYSVLGKREGVWTYYHENGKVSEKTEYKNDLKDGTMELWYDNGEKRAAYQYVKGKMQGKYVVYGYHGGLTEQGSFANDKLNGPCKVFYENDVVQYEFTYLNVKINGVFKQYDYKGTLILETNILAGKKNGLSKEFYSNGKPKSEGAYKGNEPFGQWKVYWDNGTVMREGLYKDKGKREGMWKEYHSNGKLETEALYKAGELNGLVKNYAQTGELVNEKNFKAGKLSKVTYYDTDGKVLGKFELVGRSTVREYYPSGILAAEGDYENGKRVGLWTLYSSNGGWKRGTVTYRNGERDGKYKSYYVSGKISYETNYDDGVQSGYTKSWHPNGQIMSEGWMKHDMKQGDWFDYNVRGILTSHNYYIDDEMFGFQEYFDERGRKEEEVEIKRGIDVKRSMYDTTGAVAYSMATPGGSGKFDPKYNNGNYWHEGNYKRGLRDGKYVTYKWNGKISWEGTYLLGNLEGARKEYFDWDDKLYAETQMEFGMRNGSAIGYWENGVKSWEEHFYMDDLDGEQKYYHDNGQLRKIGTWNRGTLNGELKYFSPDGLLEYVLYYNDGDLIGYSYEGTDGVILPMKKLDEASGKVEAYYKNGKKSTTGEFQGGRNHGQWIEYYSDGSVKEDESFNYGFRDGLQKRFYPDGKPQEVENYYFGELDGECRYYYPNGNVKRVEVWTLGEQWGKWYFYNEQGQLSVSRRFSAGVQVAEEVAVAAVQETIKPKVKAKTK